MATKIKPMTRLGSGEDSFGGRLARAVMGRGNPVVVGLDPRLESLPATLVPRAGTDCRAVADAYRTFCRGIIDAVAPLVPAVKPQMAFFEEWGPPGMDALADVIDHARSRGLIVILDGKRGDIGPTAEAYAKAYLGPRSAWRADALTVNPYLGRDSLEPFVQAAETQGAGLFVLVKTSNPGSGDLQDRGDHGIPLYEVVAQHVQAFSQRTRGTCGYGSVGAVVGATYPDQLRQLRHAMPSAWLLVPGYGAQGAMARDVAAAFDDQGLGAVINNSRGIIFAFRRGEYAHLGEARWQDAAAAATGDMIAALASATAAGRLSPGGA